jgi:hypothetical protein
VEIEYRCPTHGEVEPFDPEVPSCPVMIVRDVDGEATYETCALPLSANTI